jgi:alkylhydroperoxidase family enzyme
MDRMFLEEIEQQPGTGPAAAMIAQVKAAGGLVPQIWHLFAFKPDRTRHLADFTHQVMRGPSALSPGQRELIAAFTSARNRCLF